MSSIFFSSAEKIDSIHINLWNLESNECTLDLGFYLKQEQELEIFIPFKIGSDSIQDLQPKMFKDHDLIRSIFNRHVSVSSNSSQSFCTIKMQNPTKEFDICESDIQISEEENNFSRIKLKSKDISSNHEIYLRIRLKLNEHIKEIIKEHIRKDYFLNPFKECITYIDFRINEIRFAKGKIYSELMEKSIIIENIHYFVVKKIDHALVIESPASVRSRLLGEEDIWLNYLEKSSHNEKITESLVAYHWKEIENKEERKHYGFLAGFEYKKSEKLKIFFYLAIIVFIGIITNVLTDFITGNLKANKTQKTEVISPKNFIS
jgi:hypothetical protein